MLDTKTGLYNENYLDPVLRREFGWARCYGKSLSLIKMHIDSYEELVNTYDNSRIKKVMQKAGKVLAESSRGGDIMISAGAGDFLILLPDTSEQGAGKIAQRIRKTLVTELFPKQDNDGTKIIFGVATTSSKEIESPADLLVAASDALEKAQEQKDGALTG